MQHLTKNNLRTNRHIKYISSYLHKINSGQINKLIVTMPPQHGKSSLISEFGNYWFLGNNPDKRILFVTYAAEYASHWARKVRNHIDETGKELFGIELDKKTESWFTLKNHIGSLTGLGIGGQVTGKSADLLIIDDPIKNIADINTSRQRDKLYDYYRTSLLTRVQPKGAIIIIMTRWHKDDLVGRLLREEKDDWTLINLPAFAKENDPLNRNVGEALWPEAYDGNLLNERKSTLGHYYFSAMYQQEPVGDEYKIFNPNWWNYYTSLPSFDFKMQVWDTAFKNNEENDYSVCITFGVNNTGIYIIDIYRGKPLFPILKRKVKELYENFNVNLVGIEDAGSGQSLIQDLKDNERTIPIKEIPTKNKVIRAHGVTALIESGEVYLPKEASWLTDFMNELSDFPKGAHDDQVDPLTMGLEYLKPILNEIKYPVNLTLRKKPIKNNKYGGF